MVITCSNNSLAFLIFFDINITNEQEDKERQYHFSYCASGIKSLFILYVGLYNDTTNEEPIFYGIVKG